MQSGVEATVYRYADGSASTFVSASAGSGSSVRTEGECRDGDGANIRPYAVAVKDVGCASKKSSGGTVFYTECLVKAIYPIGTASFYFDGTRASGKFTIDRVYGGACNYLLSCGAPKVQRKISSSTRHALADMTVRGTPVKGVGWTQYLLVRVTNKGVMTAYGDYGYIK